jgi:predicted porin
MKKHILALSVMTLCVGSAHADNVTVYGIIDAGVNYFSSAIDANGNKASVVKMDTGVSQGSRIGFKGTEDLGGGLKAIFNIENGFNLDDGTQGQGALFGRQAFVGLSDATLGTVTMGRQYDFMVNMGAYATGAQTVSGSLAWGLRGDGATGVPGNGLLNDRVSGDRTNNALKYESAKLGGFTFGAMYGFGEVAGSTSAGRTLSALASYAAGPLSTSLAYTEVKNVAATSTVRIYGLGASYQLATVKPYALITQAKDTGTSRKLTTYELGAAYNLSPTLILGGGYQYQQRNQGVGKAQQLNVSLDYLLSKRTDIYTAVAYNNDKGYNSVAMAGGGVKAAGGSQTILRVGVRHKF